MYTCYPSQEYKYANNKKGYGNRYRSSSRVGGREPGTEERGSVVGRVAMEMEVQFPFHSHSISHRIPIEFPTGFPIGFPTGFPIGIPTGFPLGFLTGLPKELP